MPEYAAVGEATLGGQFEYETADAPQESQVQAGVVSQIRPILLRTQLFVTLPGAGPSTEYIRTAHFYYLPTNNKVGTCHTVAMGNVP